MGFEVLSPQLLPLIQALGAAAVGFFSMFVNRRSRAVAELDKLLDMRKKCEDGSAEAKSLDHAIVVLAPRVSRRVRRRINPIGVATFSIVAVVLLTVSYVAWTWYVSTENPWILGLSTAVTFGSLVFLAGGLPILSKVEGEEDRKDGA